MAKGRSDVGRRCEVYRGDSRNACDNQTIAAKFRQYFAIQVAILREILFKFAA